MPKKRSSKKKTQHEKFVAPARASGASGSEEDFVGKLHRLMAKSPDPKSKRRKR